MTTLLTYCRYIYWSGQLHLNFSFLAPKPPLLEPKISQMLEQPKATLGNTCFCSCWSLFIAVQATVCTLPLYLTAFTIFSPFLWERKKFANLMRGTFWCDCKLQLHILNLLTDFYNEEKTGILLGSWSLRKIF